MLIVYMTKLNNMNSHYVLFNFIKLLINLELCLGSVLHGTEPHTNVTNLNYSKSNNLADNGEFNLLILHTNDMHSRILETSKSSVPLCRENICYGGFARLKSAAKQIKEKYEKDNWSVLFLNAGDNFQGSPFYNIHKWRVLSDLIPDIGFDAMCLGNHEFDDGVEKLSKYLVNLSSPPIVSCNLNFSDDKWLHNISLPRSKIFSMKGIQVGVVGYLTPESKSSGITGNVSFENEIECLRTEVAHLKALNVDIIIALGHSGYDMDKHIASEVSDIDLVIGGHSHTFLWTGRNQPSKESIYGEYPTWVDKITTSREGKQEIIKVPVIQAYAYTKYLGFLKLKFGVQFNLSQNKSKLYLKSATGNPILLSSDKFEEDLEMNEKIKKWKKEVDDQTSKEIGRTKLFLEGDASICRNRECNLGNLITDAFVDYNVRYSSNITVIPLAFIHSGSIRANIDTPDGGIFYGDLMAVLPFLNKLIKIRLKGKYIYEIFEHSISAYEYNLGRFLQVSGFKIKYNISKPVGNRVISILVRSKKNQSHYIPINLEEEYEIVTPDEIILMGVDSYNLLKSTYTVVNYLGVSDFEAVKEYLKNHSPVYPDIEGRIKFLKKHNYLKHEKGAKRN